MIPTKSAKQGGLFSSSGDGRTENVASLRRLADLLCVRGSGAPTRGLTATAAPFMVRSFIAVCALVALLMLCAGVVRAEAPGLIGNGTISSTTTPEPLGVAVDNSGGAFSGDLYVANLATPSGEPPIDKFDASGKLLSPPFGEGFYSAAAVNPVDGDLYVLNAFLSAKIEVYDPTGAPLSSFSVPPSNNFYLHLVTDVQIAVDSAGNVYVPVIPDNEVLEYSSSATLLNTFTGGTGSGALKGPSGVAVDSSGDLWVADTGDNRIEELTPADSPIGEIKSEGVEDSIALDGHGDVFAVVHNSADHCDSYKSPCSHLVEYNSAGVQIADVGAGSFDSERERGEVYPPMVAVDDSSGRVYVSDGLHKLVWVFQPPLAPVLGQESSAEVGTSEAKLGALVNPGGLQTTYRFEYDTREYSAGEGPHGVSVPFPEGSTGEGFSSRTVWASAKGLAPGTTYHYRAIVTNALGTVVGADQTFATETAAQAACPNEQTRGGFSAALPDCRAYELVTPASEDTTQPDTGQTEHPVYAGGGVGGNFAASDGNRFSYVSSEVMPGSESAGLEFIATRGAGGWSSQDALPLQPYSGDRCPFQGQSGVLQYSTDMSKAVITVNTNHEAGDCRGEIVEVVSGEPLDEENLLLRDNSDGAYQLINLTPPGVTPTAPSLVVASADLSLVVFSERAKLTPDALNNAMNLYEWSEGVVRLLKLELPSGAPVAGSVVSVSADGSDVFFTAGGSLYVRLHSGERTVQLDEKQGGSGPGGGGAFAAVNADGSQVLLTDDAAAGLTSDTVPGSGTNLYSYDVSTGRLSDLTPVGDAEAALTGVSEDGSYVYFRSKGVLSGSQANQFGETAQNGQENLYLDHGGTIAFVMHGGRPISEELGTTSISSNGAFLATNRESEIYLYSAASKRFECASCNPSGEAPTAGGVTLGSGPGFASHFVSDGGQVFFETGEALLPRDTNGQPDVYEFDYASGLRLISTGTSSSESHLIEASPSGDDVFFLTTQKLVPRDSFQEANKIYDARVDGGFPEPALPPACTTADACRSASAPQPSIYGAPSSQTFSGVGNITPPETKTKAKPKAKPVKCKKGFVKRKGKCAKKSGKKAKKSAHVNRKGK